MAPSPYHHREDSSATSTSTTTTTTTTYTGTASTSVTPAPVESSSSLSPSLSLSIPSAITTSIKSQQSEIISPTTYALAQKPILLNTPDRDTVCRPVATLQTPPPAMPLPQTSTNGIGNKNHTAAFDIDLGIQNMTLLRPTASSTEMLCTPVRNSNSNSKSNSSPGQDQGQYACAGTCSLVKGPLVLLDTPDKDTVCRPVS